MKAKTRLMDIYNKDAYVPFSIDGLQGAILLDELVNDPHLKEWYDAILSNGGMIQNVRAEQIDNGSINLLVTTLNTTGETSEKVFSIPLATAEKAGLLQKEDYRFLKEEQSKEDVIFTPNTTPIEDDADLEGAGFGWSLTASVSNDIINERLAKRASFFIDTSLDILGFLPNLKYIRLESIPENINGVFSAILPPISELGYTSATNVKVKFNKKLNRWLALWYDGKHIMPLATNKKEGLMSSTDKALLDSLPKKIADETTARTDADKTLDGKIAKEVSDRTSAVSAEQTARTSADSALEAKITEETKARTEADKALQGNIDALKKVATADANGLMSKEDKAKFDEMKAITPYAEDLQSYGVEIPKPNEGTSKVRRIGNMEMHRTLPIQSKMRGCLLDDDGKVVEYLPENDWTTATRDGSKGQVMVEIPEHWERFYINEQGLQCARISEINLPGYFFVPKMYVSAYEATLQRSTNKLCSVVNKDVDYRGGNNTAEYDGQYNSLLGMPVTMLSREKFREYARNRNANKTTEWNCYLYEAHRILFWFYIIEYADRNIQLDYNAQKTAEGFMQGGLGVATSIAWGDWTTYNKTNPIVPCGYTDEFGNRSGAKQISIDNNAGITHTRWVPRYRGVENLFGHIFLFCDGVNIKVSPTIENGGDNTSKVYVCNDPSKFNGTNYDGYEYIGNETRVNTYITDILFGKRGHTINKEGISGGNTQIGYCDYAYTDTKNKMEELRVLLLGGRVDFGSAAGLACTYSYYLSASANPGVGSRLCFSPSDAKHDTNPI